MSISTPVAQPAAICALMSARPNHSRRQLFANAVNRGLARCGENADEVAQALYSESRGEKHDHFDGPILYRDSPVY